MNTPEPNILQLLWLIPAMPLTAAAILALAGREQRALARWASLGAMTASFLLSLVAFSATFPPAHDETVVRLVFNFTWLQFGDVPLRIGWVLDPLSACMLVMVTLISALVFLFSFGYMADDPNFTRFFCFLSLFAAAMLGLVIANSLLLFFICWELVGLASYLLIGFWFQRPSAAIAARKAFIVTRIGDLGLFLGMLWWFGESGTLLFYDAGRGCLEPAALESIAAAMTSAGLATATAISLLVFCGAIGKSGQVPLHVWLPDAMEGPTPVSALIHAATMVAAGVYLVARVYPLMDADPAGLPGQSDALTIIAWMGAITAVFAATVATAQSDIKRILAYSTVSQLGYMLLGIGVGGIALGMFHLITHAFFKALLFLGAGSVIHGCHHEQDIRRLGGLRKAMPITFATYAIGMMALAGFPFLFSGFWSKDEILLGAYRWSLGRALFWMGLTGAVLTAFYMTRQVSLVFFGKFRGEKHGKSHHGEYTVHESPKVMLFPLGVLAAGTVLLSAIGTPWWPWFHRYLLGHVAHQPHLSHEALWVMGLSIAGVAFGVWCGWRWYGRRPPARADAPDPFEQYQPELFAVLRSAYSFDRLYDLTWIHWTRALAAAADWMDYYVWGGMVRLASAIWSLFGWMARLCDEFLVNMGFDSSCGGLRWGGKLLSLAQNGNVQRYLRAVALGLALLILALLWGCRP